MAKMDMIETTINGNSMTPVGALHARMVLRVVDRDQLERVWNDRIALIKIAEKFDVSVSDVTFLIKYYEFPKRIRSSPEINIKNIDFLAERLYEVLEDRIKKLVEEAVK